MKLKILDASVAIKWFVDESGREKALEILSEVESDPRAFAVPELFFNEMLAVFCRLQLTEKQIVRYVQILEQLGFYRIGNGSELLAAAAQLAVKYRLSGYDAIYVAAAKLTSGVWITCDAQAHQKLKGLGLSQMA